MKRTRHETWEFGYRHPDTGAIHPPNAKQQIAHNLDQQDIADEIFYGGQVGGGKSEWLIVSAIRDCLVYPKSEVAVFRRTRPELLKSLVGRFRDLVPPHIAKFNQQDFYAKFHATGSILWFCYCQHESNVSNYQSAQWRSLNVDEGTHFTEFILKYLIGRVRKASMIGRKRVRIGSNPGSVGHGMIKRRYIKPVAAELGNRPLPKPFEAWRPFPLPGDRTPPDEIMRRVFVPATFDDNLVLKAADPHYLSQIWAIGGDTAKQLGEGNWDANESMIVGSVWKEYHTVSNADEMLVELGCHVGQLVPWHVIPNDKWVPPAGALIFGSVDYGYGAPWSFHLHAALPGGHTRTFFELYMAGKRDEEQARMIRNVLETRNYRPEWIVMDPSMWNSREEMGVSKSIAEVYENELGRPCNVLLMKGAGGRNARKSRPQRWLAALSTAPDGIPWWSVTSACPDLIRTVPEIPKDPNDPDVEDDSSENHCIAKGTLIATDRGEIPIEHVGAGDRVMTRDGFQLVERAWLASPSRLVYRVRTASGHFVRATADHEIWTTNRGFVRVDELTQLDSLYIESVEYHLCRMNRPSWFRRPFKNGAVSGTISTVSTSLASAAHALLRRVWDVFIDMSMKTCAVPFRTATTSTIETRTARTTVQTISNYEKSETTSAIMAVNQHQRSARLAERINEWRKQRAWRCPRRSLLPARAAQFSTINGKASDATVQRSASTARVTSVEVDGYSAVHDLTVQHTHEFLANGILVSNCYEDVGRFFEARPHAPIVKPVDPVDQLDQLSRQEAQSQEKLFSRKKKVGRFGALGRH